MKEVLVDIERCTACKACEIACAVEHSSSKNLFNAIREDPPPKNRVHVEKAFTFSYPARCMHCAGAPCIEACPKAAMSRNRETGSVAIDETKCKGCLRCCPYGAISPDPVKKVALKCDRCDLRTEKGKSPACVEACPTGALAFGEPEEKKRKFLGSKAFAVAVHGIKGKVKKTPPKKRRLLTAEAVVVAMKNMTTRDVKKITA